MFYLYVFEIQKRIISESLPRKFLKATRSDRYTKLTSEYEIRSYNKYTNNITNTGPFCDGKKDGVNCTGGWT